MIGSPLDQNQREPVRPRRRLTQNQPGFQSVRGTWIHQAWPWAVKAVR